MVYFMSERDPSNLSNDEPRPCSEPSVAIPPPHAKLELSRWQRYRKNAKRNIQRTAVSAVAIGAIAGVADLIINYEKSRAQQKLEQQVFIWKTSQQKAQTAELNLMDTISRTGAMCARHTFLLEPGLREYMNPTPVSAHIGNKVVSNLAEVVGANGNQKIAHQLLVVDVNQGGKTIQLAGEYDVSAANVVDGQATTITSGGSFIGAQALSSKFNRWFNLTQAKADGTAQRLPVFGTSSAIGGVDHCSFTHLGDLIDHGQVAGWAVPIPADVSNQTIQVVQQASQ